ncbi:MAG: MFS transporter [Anaerolineae bacterium]|nr:MFS transporter [Anaerolineae bacterium]
MKRNRLATIFAIVFVDLLGFSLILPLLPYYAEKYGATPTVVGLLVASYALAQFIGSPVLGRLSDRYGRRPILLVSIAGTVLGFLLLGFADPLGKLISGASVAVVAVLFFSRILDGLTGGNLTVAQAYITDVTDNKNRAKALGMIGAAFGLGFIIGPVVGGLLSRWGYAVPAFVAAGLATANWFAVLFLLPESLTPEARLAMAQRPRAEFSLRALVRALNRPRVGPLLHIRFLFALASGLFQSIFALYAQQRLGLDAQVTGYVLGYVGLLVVIVQGGLIGRLTARFAEKQLIFASTILLVFAFVAWALTPSLPILLIVLIPMSVGTGVMNTVINSALSKSVYPEEVGGTLGLAASLESLTRVIAPTVGGVLLGQVGAWSPGIVGAIIMGWLVSFVYRRLIVNPDPPLPTRGEPRWAEAVV